MQNLTLKQADRWLKAGIFSSRQIVEHCLQRIAETDGTLKAWLALNADQALAEAAAADDRRKHGHRRGVLDGVPYACKDLIDTAGLETTAASKVLQGNVPRRDATVVTRLRGAGAQRRLHPRSGAPLAGLRLGLPVGYFTSHFPGVTVALNAAVQVLKDQGAEMVEVEAPRAWTSPRRPAGR